MVRAITKIETIQFVERNEVASAAANKTKLKRSLTQVNAADVLGNVKVMGERERDRERKYTCTCRQARIARFAASSCVAI